MISKDRLSSITDAIIAVAATIMVLRLDIPDKASFAAVQSQWPVLLAYTISFTQIFLGWHEHHDMFLRMEKVNHRIFIINSLWLILITLVPFVTGMVGKSPNDRASLILYIVILVLQNLVMMIESNMLVKLNGFDINDAGIIKRLRTVTLIGYGIAFVCVLIKPLAGLVTIVLICIVNIVMMWHADSQTQTLKDKNPD